MSAVARKPLTTQQPDSRPERTTPELAVVTSVVQRRSRMPFAFMCVVLILGAMLGTLVLNTTMADRSYEMTRLQSELNASRQTEQTLMIELESLNAPSELSARASKLGMVPAEDLGYISITDGRVAVKGSD